MIHSAIHSAATHLRHTARARPKPAPRSLQSVFRCSRSVRQHCGEPAALNTTAGGAQGCRCEIRRRFARTVLPMSAQTARARCVGERESLANTLPALCRQVAMHASADCVRPAPRRCGALPALQPGGRHLDTMRRSFHQWEQSLVTAYCHSVSCPSCASRRLQPRIRSR